MATIAHYGPYPLDFGSQGLAPGQFQNTWWFGWQPQPEKFTVVVTAHPDTSEAGNESHQVTNTLYISDHSVQYVPHVSGDIVTQELIIYATLGNDGSGKIRWANLYITFIQP